MPSLLVLRLIAEPLGRLPGGAVAQRLIVAAERIATRLPAGSWVLRRLADIEDSVVDGLRQRLSMLEATAATTPRPTAGAGRGRANLSMNGHGPGQLFQSLLERGMEQTADEARADALNRIVASLVPDEAKVLVWLAGSDARPVIHIHEAPAIGGNSVTLLRNISGASRSAGVRSRDLAPAYIDHLVDLGLVEYGPEAPDLGVEYEILEAETQVREAIAHLEHTRMRRAKIVRHTLVMTSLGCAIWASYTGEPLA